MYRALFSDDFSRGVVLRSRGDGREASIFRILYLMRRRSADLMLSPLLRALWNSSTVLIKLSARFNPSLSLSRFHCLSHAFYHFLPVPLFLLGFSVLVLCPAESGFN